MSVVRIPSPLRPYTEGQKEVEADGATVMAVLEDLGRRFPSLRSHLFNGNGALRPYVNIFINDRDIRGLEGEATPVVAADRLMIVPSIAGGSGIDLLRPVDHAALRTNQAVIIGLLLAAFIADAPALVAVVGAVVLWGSARGRPGFVGVYRLLRAAGRLQPEVLNDNPEPHRFAQLVGGFVLSLGAVAFVMGAASAGWFLTAVVVALAGINLFAGVCVGCALYYWLARFHVPGFTKSPPAGTRPGRRPMS
jgi:molybdopterin converting factor small subunit